MISAHINKKIITKEEWIQEGRLKVPETKIEKEKRKLRDNKRKRKKLIKQQKSVIIKQKNQKFVKQNSFENRRYKIRKRTNTKIIYKPNESNNKH